MRRFFHLFLVITVFIFVGTVTAQTATQKQNNGVNLASVNRQLAESNRSFTYRGKPIHPRAIEALGTGVADRLPGTIVIDVGGTYESNRYFGDIKRKADKLIYTDLKEGDEEGWVGYKYLGRLANGLHVLRTFDNGGGTGVFENLLLVEFTTDYEYNDNGTRRSRLILKRMGEYVLGDRYEGTITLNSKANSILVGVDRQHEVKRKTIVIR